MGEIDPNASSFSGFVDILAGMDRGLYVRFDRKPTIVAGSAEVIENAFLDGVFIDVTSYVITTVLAWLRALNVDVGD